MWTWAALLPVTCHSGLCKSASVVGVCQLRIVRACGQVFLQLVPDIKVGLSLVAKSTPFQIQFKQSLLNSVEGF